MVKLETIQFKDKDKDKIIKGVVIENNDIFFKVDCEKNVYEIGKMIQYVIKTPKKDKGEAR